MSKLARTEVSLTFRVEQRGLEKKVLIFNSQNMAMLAYCNVDMLSDTLRRLADEIRREREW